MESRTTAEIARIWRIARPRAKSLLVTILGDAMPLQGEFALGALLDLAAECGIGKSVGRTAVARLTGEGWLSAARHGRRSYCRMTPAARAQVQAASRRIYGAGGGWDGKWRVVLFAPSDDPAHRARREKFKRAAEWEGFARWSAQALIHPRPDLARFAALRAASGLSESAVTIICGAARPPQAMDEIAAQCWDLKAMEARYRLFVRRFAPLAKIVVHSRPSPATAFRARILTIHEYRRALLRDPGLPPGRQAAAAAVVSAAIPRAASADYAAAVIAGHRRAGA